MAPNSPIGGEKKPKRPIPAGAKKKPKRKDNEYTIALGVVFAIIAVIAFSAFFTPASQAPRPGFKPKESKASPSPAAKPATPVVPKTPWTKDILVAGDGSTYPAARDFVSIHYEGKVVGKDEPFDNSRQRNEIFRFPLGVGQIMPGLDQAIQKMTLGETARITLPPEWAYGEKGYEDLIPPSSTLIFDVELLGINTNFKTDFEMGEQTFSDENLAKYRAEMQKLQEETAKKKAEEEAAGGGAAAGAEGEAGAAAAAAGGEESAAPKSGRSGKSEEGVEEIDDEL
ncbi:hypothetical protein BJ742DRAFT_564008 [Cladochytrium replicatum]|nr:hypothetical protein BJ742DRAFT_564008 [Cladochytrium replicatum]